mgnify:CR=1 FL=1
MPQESTTASEGAGEDRELLSRIARQERTAFDALYRPYYRRMFHFVLRVVRREEIAEEVVDDAMFAVWRPLEQFRDGGRSAGSRHP